MTWVRKHRDPAHNFKDRTGQTFGQLTVVRRGPNASNEARWVCLCSCGQETLVRASAIRTAVKGLKAGTFTCGCSRATGKGSRPNYTVNAEKHPPGRAARNAVLKGYRLGAGYRDHCWDLSDEAFDFITASPCAYCGAPPSKVKKQSRNGEWAYTGIDRVDNSLGYTISNVLPCCSICNHAKAAMTSDQWVEWLHRVSAHWCAYSAAELEAEIVRLRAELNAST